MKTLFRSKKGVSMIELVITMLLIAIIATSTFDFYAYINRFSIKAENYSAATEYCAEVLEWLLSLDYNDPALNVGAHTPTVIIPSEPELVDGMPPQCILRKYGGRRDYSVSENIWDSSWADSFYKTLTVAVTWNDGVARILTLSVRKSNLT
ncbi:MAG: prepilin-type N-terminal cleavage/methylation domain-containing protein [Candidatus Omnitrophota bacterium]|nr:prepilin-type N-terminal cleavage/methylation domain-containing protein [Candidatus Omnitrophota bacterium]